MKGKVMIVVLCGQAGSGKDTAADYLQAKYDFVKVALADPLKRYCADAFEFTDEQLWGSSEKRNAPDPRWSRPGGGEFLTPRFALQTLGTEWGRTCSPDVWTVYAVRIADRLARGDGYYDRRTGIRTWIAVSSGGAAWPKTNIVIPDMRFKNELDIFHAAGAKAIRLHRGAAGLAGAAGQHASETELQDIPDTRFDFVIKNDSHLLDLYTQLDRFVVECT